MSLDLKGNCGICLYPLSNGEKVAYHEKYTNESGQVCDGSLHPLHLKCALDALKESGIHCSSCRVPINLKSIGMCIFDHGKFQKHKKIILSIGAYTSAVIGAFIILLCLPTLPISSWLWGSDLEIEDRKLTIWVATTMGMPVGLVGYRAAEELIRVLDSTALTREKMGWIKSDNPGAKMITVNAKAPKKWVKRQPPPGSGLGHLKPMQRRRKGL